MACILNVPQIWFGRATSDVCIEIRAGRMTREGGIEILKKYDGEFPEELFPSFLEFMKMSEKEAWKIFDKWANKNILEKIDGQWRLKEAVR